MKTSKATKTLEALKPEKVESSANKGNVPAVSAFDKQAGRMQGGAASYLEKKRSSKAGKSNEADRDIVSV